MSRYLQQIEQESKLALQNYYEKVPYAYEEALASTKLLKRFLWAKLNNTTDARSIAGLANVLHTITIDYLRMVAMGQDVKDTVDNATMLAREARQELKELKELKEKYGTPTATVGGMLEAKESIGAKGDSSDSDSGNDTTMLQQQSSESKASEVIDSQREGRVSYIPLDVPYSTSSSSSSSESREPDALQDSFRPLRGALNPKDGKESDEDSITSSSSNGASM